MMGRCPDCKRLASRQHRQGFHWMRPGGQGHEHLARRVRERQMVVSYGTVCGKTVNVESGRPS